MDKIQKLLGAVMALIVISLILAGCGEEEKPVRTAKTAARTATSPTTTTKKVVEGIKLDPNLKSTTGTPTDEEMASLIELQGKVPYPVVVPTQLPGGYILEKDLIGSSSPSERDPTGYYSFRYSDPANPNRTLTFNQSRANAKTLSGYYLTEVEINGIMFQVYWHKTLEYLPQGDPVRTDTVGDAETFVVVWKNQYTGAEGKPQELYYSMNTGTWTGHGWGDIQYILENLKPLSSVGG